MMLLIRIWLLSVFSVLSVKGALDFTDPQTPGVSFGDSSQSTQEIKMDEENDIDIKIAIVTGATDLPTIAGLDNVANQILGVKIAKSDEDDNYIVSVGKKVDYDGLVADRNPTDFLFTVTGAANDGNKRIKLIIENIEDNNPIFTQNSTCNMKENSNSEKCEFYISDIDGNLNEMNLMDAIKDTSKNESQLFKLEYETLPGDIVRESPLFLVLQDDKELDYEDTTLFSLTIEITDKGKNPTVPMQVQIIVVVEDQPDQPPIFTSLQSSMRIQEEKEYDMRVQARDGDYGVNADVFFRIEVEGSEYASIPDEAEGLIKIPKIDRDENDLNQVEFTVTAFERDCDSASDKSICETSETVTLFIEDIDDNPPIITCNSGAKFLNLTIPERSSSLEDIKDITVVDKDMGLNAMYDVILGIEGSEDHTIAFQIIPNVGFQTSVLSLIVRNSELLNFEDETWKNIHFMIAANGQLDPSMGSNLEVHMTLTDWNDEWPIFDQETYEADVEENVDIDIFIVQVHATDADAEDKDKVKHIILGSASTILNIDELSGNVTAKTKNSFDFEKQQEVIVQIQALDTVNHTATVQLNIHVKDVNDEAPRISVGNSQISIEENRPHNDIIDMTVTASDPDTTAHLEFSIDWDASFFLKDSKRLLPDEIVNYTECITVSTEPIDDNWGSVRGNFIINDVVANNTPDFEIFDTLVLKLRVTDSNTYPGFIDSDETDINIRIDNMNDNAPVITEDTINAVFTVGEESLVDAIIGIIKATDADDPRQNFSFTLTPTDSTAAVAPDWIDIDVNSGALQVKSPNIRCDDPVIQTLEYEIIVSDGENPSEPVPISISILDKNNQNPLIDNNAKSILEDDGRSPGSEHDNEVIFELKPNDKDRDEVNRNTTCTIDSTDGSITNRFSVNAENEVFVFLKNGLTLDREDQDYGGSYVIPVVCKNVQDEERRDSAVLTLTLEDVNDNVPYIDPRLTLDGTENMVQGGTIATVIQAEDIDEGDNGRVDFELLSAIWTENNDEDHKELFSLTDSDPDKKQTTVKIEKPLKSFYGTFVLQIEASDRGTEKLSQAYNVTLNIKKFNFEAPIFVFPAEGIYYLDTVQAQRQQLLMYNGDLFPNFKASDTNTNNDSAKYSIQIAYEMLENTEDLFTLVTYPGSSMAQLQMKTASDDIAIGVEHKLRLTADIGIDEVQPGEADHTSSIDITIKFLNLNNINPIFNVTAYSFSFEEQNPNLTHTIPEAWYPEEVEHQPDLFYLKSKEVPDEDIFTVDLTTGEVSLNAALDFDRTTSYQLVIQASKKKDSPSDSSQSNESLNVTITVVDINNHDPVFSADSYFGTILRGGEKPGNVILTATGTDQDTVENKLSYSIEGPITASDSSIESIKDPFKMETDTGKITLEFDLQQNMKGHFQFRIKVEDEGKRSSEVDVIIYIVTEINTIDFRFGNELEVVASKLNDIVTILNNFFGYSSNVQQPSQGTDSVSAPVYFVDMEAEVPINGSDILRNITRVSAFTALRNEFADKQLILLNFVTESPSENIEEILKAWLIGVSVVLGALLVIILVAFILKTRQLKSRVKKLLKPKFGSQESGLNRLGIAAPGTNKHAVAGSNPVFNNDADMNEIDKRSFSIASGDSDLIGVEDNPEFTYDSFRDDENQFAPESPRNNHWENDATENYL